MSIERREITFGVYSESRFKFINCKIIEATFIGVKYIYRLKNQLKNCKQN